MGVYCLLGDCEGFYYAERMRKPLAGSEYRSLREEEREDRRMSYDAIAMIQETIIPTLTQTSNSSGPG